MTQTRPLFDIMPDHLALNELFEADGGELGSPEIEAAFVEWTTTLQIEEGKKLDSYVNLIKKLEGEAVVAKAEADQYQAKARSRENRVRWLKNRMKTYLEVTGRRSVQTATGRTVSIVSNGGALPMNQTYAANPADMTTEEILACDERFLRPRTALDTSKIKAALEAGEALELARLEPRGTRLNIR